MFEFDEVKLSGMEADMINNEWFAKKVKESNVFAQNLYAAMCNNTFYRINNPDEKFQVSWRSSGGVIATIRQEGNYIDWYCSGIKSSYDDDDIDRDAQMTPEQEAFINELDQYVGEGQVTDEIKLNLLQIGWAVHEKNDV